MNADITTNNFDYLMKQLTGTYETKFNDFYNIVVYYIEMYRLHKKDF